MENRPVISITAISRSPGADTNLWKRFDNWKIEVYMPISAPNPGSVGGDRYNIVKKKSEYPETLSVGHYTNLMGWQNYADSPERTDIVKDVKAWTDRGIAVQIWSTFTLSL